jgi:hypothetical protein
VDVTLNLARFTNLLVPPEGSPCPSYTQYQSFLASVSRTTAGCTYPAADTFDSHRNLPELDFATESNPPLNQFRPYVSKLTVTTYPGIHMVPNDGISYGCYKIWWF